MARMKTAAREARAPSDTPLDLYTGFVGDARAASGPLHDVAAAVRRALDNRPDAKSCIFADADGRPVDVDLRGTPEEIAARLSPPPPAPRGPGRPRLGVVAREVTLLPRHWDWLAAQPGGASVALRKLVEEASRDPRTRRRRAQEAAYRFMTAMAGDRPGYEEACRTLFADDLQGLEAHSAAWPAEVREHALRLARGAG